MKDLTKLFFDLIKVSLGNKDTIEPLPSEKEWKMLFELTNKQSLTSVLLEGINNLKKLNNCSTALPQAGLNIPKVLLLEWIGQQQISIHLNEIQNERTKELCKLLDKASFRSCVLKGQGTAQYYDRPEIRQCGDIDVWVSCEGKWDADKSRDEILKFVRSKGYHVGHIDIKHSDIDFFKDVPVEVHFLPSWMYNPATNKKLQHFFEEQAEKQFSNKDPKVGFTHTTVEFDLVFSIVHIYRHIFSEGVGLRQLYDYYYILQHSNQKQRIDAFAILDMLKMGVFVGGVMWILRNCMGMKEEYLLCPVNEKHGKFLLNEIMTGGNFGHFDNRRTERGNKGKFEYGFIQFKKNLRFVSYYPSEVLWSPLWKTWHYLWRKRKGYL